MSISDQEFLLQNPNREQLYLELKQQIAEREPEIPEFDEDWEEKKQLGLLHTEF